MNIAALYDIHGNATALESVLDELSQYNVNQVLIGGDLVWGPEPREVMDILMNYKDKFVFIRGNADREVAYRYDTNNNLPEFVSVMNHWCADQLTTEQIDFLKGLQDCFKTNDYLFIHGSPRSDEESIRKDTPKEEIVPMIEGTYENTIICGHTHVQFDRRIDNKRIVNAGSIGLQSNAPGACWVMISDKDIELKVTQYDIKKASERILNSNCPYKMDFADHILHPPKDGP